MIILPNIQGVVARTAHPLGCHQAVLNQINYVKSAPQVANGPKKVLVLGASSGFGLASRISLAFGGAKADTIGVSFERGPSEKGVGTAGWYNNIYFRQEAEKEGLVAKNFVGDAFSATTREQVVDYIKHEFGGSVDLVVYSLATGVRPNPETGELWRSSIKTSGAPVIGPTINIEHDSLESMEVGTATSDEMEATIKVMGGEDWQGWIDYLYESGVLACGCKTVAYSYVGPEVTYPIYHHGTLGRAKAHLHDTADELNQKMQVFGGEAYVSVCKALVTKASVFIPAFSPYILSLFKVMKEKGTHEGCIEQMQRLFAQRLYSDKPWVPVDGARLIRMDDWELEPETQQEVKRLMSQMTVDNFRQVGDYAGYKSDFMQLNGFGFSEVNYDSPVNMEELTLLQP
ncbi:Involved in the final reduction of the elongation cycle of fatty acid synthesis (FAS II). Catalyzes the reduction of a carbon-carbon double bond in an enoyl moiety that is covalently linked to an acyl carrier protein (ACP) [Vibrio sp. B1REV9]|uniref:enoyl-ACP reductase FabV n=1 Tax=Vibrio sp. B1REV9 TaxID=2751179 RepID=UPI001AFC460B|nr:enoyl-ACP reductase FabV [Vibrio sp. B1REV9]CAE6939680.1 Involved in the final reduction of the elongation cycle of fatty acid synthesis (FAS II). Catalyzes the reduction of a carbon-carbon double bond in an enoyl moiety that is covalently linked to an acyl carrier protein (ACP) [Vibrio sp. B1REV9]